MQSITEVLRGEIYRVYESCKGEIGGEMKDKRELQHHNGVLLFKQVFFPLANPTRKYKNGENPGRETGTRIKFVNEI